MVVEPYPRGAWPVRCLLQGLSALFKRFKVVPPLVPVLLLQVCEAPAASSQSEGKLENLASQMCRVSL